MGACRMKRWLTIWMCVLFHEKEIRQFRLPDELFTFNLGRFKGCFKCDVWRRIDDIPLGTASCCSLHSGGDEECKNFD